MKTYTKNMTVFEMRYNDDFNQNKKKKIENKIRVCIIETIKKIRRFDYFIIKPRFRHPFY